MQLLFQLAREPRERTTCSCLHGTEGNPYERGDLALRQPAPVGELDQLALLVRQRLQRRVDAPGQPAELRLLVRSRLVRRLVRRLRRRLAARAATIGDAVPRDGEQPRRRRSALRTVGLRRPPDRG